MVEGDQKEVIADCGEEEADRYLYQAAATTAEPAATNAGAITYAAATSILPPPLPLLAA